MIVCLIVMIGFPALLYGLTRNRDVAGGARWTPRLAPNENVRLVGNVDGKSTVTLNHGGRIEITGRIDNGSTVTISNCGNVDFGGKIDNNSNVRIDVRGAKVLIRGKVDGGSKLTVECEEFKCEGNMDNPQTVVELRCKSYSGPRHVNGTLIVNGRVVSRPRTGN